MLGHGMRHHESSDLTGFFRKVLDFAGKQQTAKVSNACLRVRMHSGEGGDYLWIANYRKDGPISAVVELPGREITGVEARKGEAGTVKNGKLHITVPARDVTVVKAELK